MDYKHRVPGYRPRKTRKFRLSWLLLLVGAAIVGSGMWWAIHTEEERAPPSEPAPPTTQLPAPPIHSPRKPEEQKAAKSEKDRKNTDTSAERKGEAEPKADPPKAAPKKGMEAPAVSKPVEPRFSFYKILPEKEVIIPESEIRNMKQEEKQGTKPAGTSYLIQAGSFANLEDAEKLKAQLSHLKVKSKIESVRIENVEWHRVKIGPFTSLVDADRTRLYLRSNGIDSVVQKAASR